MRKRTENVLSDGRQTMREKNPIVCRPLMSTFSKFFSQPMLLLLKKKKKMTEITALEYFWFQLLWIVDLYQRIFMRLGHQGNQD